MGKKDLLFRLFYGSNSRGDIDGTAIDIGRYMQGIGLVEGIHYDKFPMSAIFQEGSLGVEIYNSSDGVGFSVLKGHLTSGLEDAPFALFGYHAVGSYLKKNKKRIQGTLRRLEDAN